MEPLTMWLLWYVGVGLVSFFATTFMIIDEIKDSKRQTKLIIASLGLLLLWLPVGLGMMIYSFAKETE